MAQLYNDFGTWIRTKFPFRVQKIAVDAGFTCPNRDGSIGYGGCTYCNNKTFNPVYCDNQKTITAQLEEGKMFFKRKYPDMRYLAYFQAYTNTYGSMKHLRAMYEEALRVPDVVGLVIGTRPDCLSDELLTYLSDLNKRTFLIVEYGVETINDNTLRRINRGHTFECSKTAIEKTHALGIIIGVHVILGLPGEDENESIRQAKIISSLPVDILKIHQLQIIQGTKLAMEYTSEPFRLYSLDEYINLIIKYIMRLRPNLVLERFVSQSPKDLLIAPSWGIKNYEFTNKLLARMKEVGTYQGKETDILNC